MNIALLILLCLFLVVMFGIGIWSNKRVSDEEDFIVGGRNFNLYFTSFSLFATWFGAGTLMTATDEIQSEGLRAMNLEPFGAGLCLIIAGLFFAKKLWEMKLLTLSDFFKEKFGPMTETFSVITTIPIYVGWIAVQFVALAQLLSNFFPVEPGALILIIAVLATALTMIGGLWSVTVTDSVQMIVIIAGLLLMFANVVGSFSGFEQMLAGVDAQMKIFFPRENVIESINWLGVLSVAALGNLSGQDVLQRIFSAKSPKVARNGCLLAGVMYIVFGSIPALLGIFSWQLLKDDPQGNVIAKLSQAYLPPWLTAVFTLCVCATVFSTLTSALLAPASVIANNFLKEKYRNTKSIVLCRMSVLLMTILSLMVAFLGENFYGVLEESYALGLVCFFPPLVIGIYDSSRLGQTPCLISMGCGLGVWLIGFFVDFGFPAELVATAFGFASYYMAYHLSPMAQEAKQA